MGVRGKVLRITLIGMISTVKALVVQVNITTAQVQEANDNAQEAKDSAQEANLRVERAEQRAQENGERADRAEERIRRLEETAAGAEQREAQAIHERDLALVQVTALQTERTTAVTRANEVEARLREAEDKLKLMEEQNAKQKEKIEILNKRLKKMTCKQVLEFLAGIVCVPLGIKVVWSAEVLACCVGGTTLVTVGMVFAGCSLVGAGLFFIGDAVCDTETKKAIREFLQRQDPREWAISANHILSAIFQQLSTSQKTVSSHSPKCGGIPMGSMIV